MTCAAATFPGVSAFARRVFRVFALADYRRAIRRGVVIGFGTVTAAGAMAGAATMIAACFIGVSFATNPNLNARTSMALQTAALTKPYGGLAAAANLSGLAGFPADSADPPDSTREQLELTQLPRFPAQAGIQTESADIAGSRLGPSFRRDGRMRPPDSISTNIAFDAEPISAAALPSPSSAPQLPPNRPSERANDVPLPSPRPLDGPQSQSQHEIAGSPAVPALSQVAAITPLPLASRSFNLFQKRFTPQQARNNLISVPAPDSRTAIYDIEAHTVYLPNGVRLEAHSGLGRRLDDPRYVGEKDRGPTPPNVYDLVLREELFHGVRAIRLNPVDDSKMFGRDGILAHTYMLGPTGQSFGCVSFRNYPEFLKAFLSGEIDRLVVVPHLESKTSDQRARRGDADRYAFNNR